MVDNTLRNLINFPVIDGIDSLIQPNSKARTLKSMQFYGSNQRIQELGERLQFEKDKTRTDLI